MRYKTSCRTRFILLRTHYYHKWMRFFPLNLYSFWGSKGIQIYTDIIDPFKTYCVKPRLVIFLKTFFCKKLRGEQKNMLPFFFFLSQTRFHMWKEFSFRFTILLKLMEFRLVAVCTRIGLEGNFSGKYLNIALSLGRVGEEGTNSI